MKRTLSVILAVLVAASMAACVPDDKDELTIRLEDKISQLVEEKDIAQKKLDESMAENESIKGEISQIESQKEEFLAQIAEYEESIAASEEKMMFDKSDTGAEFSAFLVNLINYAIFYDYEGFTELINDDYGVERNDLDSFETFDSDYNSIYIAEIYDSETTSGYAWMEIKYNEDTGNIISIEMSLNNYADDENAKKEYDETVDFVLTAYIMTVYGPMNYSETVSKLVGEFKETGVCPEGKANLYTWEFEDFKRLIIK